MLPAEQLQSGEDRPGFDIADERANSTKLALKRAAHSCIRFAHKLVAQGPLESRIALYFHQLQAEQWDEFSASMKYFMDRGYRTVSASEFVAAEAGERCLFVSFDDNFRGWYEALGLLRDLDVKATFYVNTLPFRDVAERAEVEDYLRRLRLPLHHQTLTRGELRAMRDAGHTIGCHSHSHFILSGLPREAWDKEIRESKLELERLLGEPVTDFSWPYGMRRHFSDELRQYCVEVGFNTITNAMPGCQRIAGRDRLDIYRTDWHFGSSLEHNLTNLRINGQLYAALTGGSVIG